MKISYFFIAYFFVMSLSIKPSVINDIKNWWNAKSETKKQAVYQTAQGHVANVLTNDFLQNKLNEAYTTDWVWENITRPQLYRVASAVGGVAAVGAATYGLYQWAARRGFSGISNDCKTIDAKTTAVLHQIDNIISGLSVKESLSKADEVTAKGLSTLIVTKIRDEKINLEKFTDREQALKKILEHQKINAQAKK